MKMTDMPNGTLVQYKKHRYFVSEGTASRGVIGRIATDEEGNWTFLKDLNWKKFVVLSDPRTTWTMSKGLWTVNKWDLFNEKWYRCTYPMSRSKAEKEFKRLSKDDPEKEYMITPYREKK